MGCNRFVSLLDDARVVNLVVLWFLNSQFISLGQPTKSELMGWAIFLQAHICSELSGYTARKDLLELCIMNFCLHFIIRNTFLLGQFLGLAQYYRVPALIGAAARSNIFNRHSIDFRFEVHRPSLASSNNLDKYSIVPWVTTSEARPTTPIAFSSTCAAAIIAEKGQTTIGREYVINTRKTQEKWNRTCSRRSIYCCAFTLFGVSNF